MNTSKLCKVTWVRSDARMFDCLVQKRHVDRCIDEVIRSSECSEIKVFNLEECLGEVEGVRVPTYRWTLTKQFRREEILDYLSKPKAEDEAHPGILSDAQLTNLQPGSKMVCRFTLLHGVIDSNEGIVLQVSDTVITCGIKVGRPVAQREFEFDRFTGVCISRYQELVGGVWFYPKKCWLARRRAHRVTC